MVGRVKRCILKADKLTIFPVNSFPVMIKSLMASNIESLAVVVLDVLMLEETEECCVPDPMASGGCFRLVDAAAELVVLVTGFVPPLSTDLDGLMV